jgi:predicted N-acetyltransferase YhbS
MVAANITLRAGNQEDADACGRICHDAFAVIAEKHGFPKDFPSREIASEVLRSLLSHPRIYSVVAERNGERIGSNFLDERGIVTGVGPITVDPDAQDRGVGRLLMENVMERAAQTGAAGVRLLQDAFHNRSFSLYTKIGFKMRVTTSVMQGPPVAKVVAGYGVRQASATDLESCNMLCFRVHGHDRNGEVSDAISQGAALVVERDGRITGYTTAVAFFGHSVGETNDDLKALIAAATEFGGLGFHVPNTNTELLLWCYDNGLTMVKAMTLMTVGLYNDPDGAYLPSVLY